MPFFRKKPLVIEARRVTPDNGRELAQWIASSVTEQHHVTVAIDYAGPYAERPGVHVPTIDGNIAFAGVGVWVCRGVEGEFYPCQDSVLQATYDQVPAMDPVTDPAPRAARG